MYQYICSNQYLLQHPHNTHVKGRTNEDSEPSHIAIR